MSALTAGGTGLVYRGPFTYRRSSAGALTLESAACEEGRLTPSGAMLHVTDHIGSVVAVVRGSDGALYEASEYDACGKRSSLTNAGTVSLPSGVTQRDRFTGKEDQDPDFAVGYTDFGARHYSPSLRRWLVPDPLSEKYYGISPYANCAGDPVNRVDSDGRIWETMWDIANVVMDVKSLTANISEGNVGRAIVDGASTVVDIAAAAVPFIPGGAGAAMKAARGVDKAVDVAKTPGYVVDAAKAADKIYTTKRSLKESASIGQEAHRQIEKELLDSGLSSQNEVSIILQNGIKVRKDAKLIDGTYVIIKPDTPSGHKAAKARQRLMEDNSLETMTIFYNPNNPAYLPGSPTYIGPKYR